MFSITNCNSLFNYSVIYVHYFYSSATTLSVISKYFGVLWLIKEMFLQLQETTIKQIVIIIKYILTVSYDILFSEYGWSMEVKITFYGVLQTYLVFENESIIWSQDQLKHALWYQLNVKKI